MTQAARRRLFAVRLAHTVVWAFFAGCILAIVPLAFVGQLRLASILCGVVVVEVVVLMVNRWKCPLTPIAARYTDDRAPNFDIFLPVWLARYNKEIFGTLYVGGVVIVAYLWIQGA